MQENLKMIEYKKALTESISSIGNEYGFPIVFQRMCVAEILTQMDLFAQQQVAQEQLELQNKLNGGE